MDTTAEHFIDWFKLHGSQHASIGLTEFPGMGRGAIALDDIEEDTVLFSIPRTLLLNTENSKLRSLLKEEEWSTLKNWTPLILAVMWESRQGDSLWKPYSDIMPRQFDSLMFWSESELNELEGCAVLSKIGKEEAIKDYEEIIKPLVASRPDVFGSSDYYSEDLYNQMGSLILSRSFHVEDPEDEDGDEDDEDEAKDEEVNNEADESNASLLQAAEGMDIHNENGHIEEDGDSEDEEEDDQEEVKHIAMVPWADMLNARHGCDNARLFYEKECLNMTTTKPIKKGEQIWNVYGDPPNSDLLRRYGHVDDDNPADVAEITADLVAEIACSSKDKAERIETLLDVELDDTYTFTLEDHEDDLVEMLAAIAVFTADKQTLAKIQKKGKVPKKGLKEEKRFLRIAKAILEKRLSQYPHSFDDDDEKLKNPANLEERLRYAIVVRHSEMRILRALIDEISGLLPPEAPKEPVSKPKRPMSKKELREEKKRAREEEAFSDGIGSKRSRK
ncbi:SET domain-containing protein [Cystobasidium minutum MCA 4210]|uniref:SET domain-containing protein n=1 Tax=Cystobasidium minutum MCA 4210 TaxID=1397322 RepID=UPI0034CD7CBB|eukprot:jgi/Rhomi1/208508/estExt_Genemark1.C_2_t10189